MTRSVASTKVVAIAALVGVLVGALGAVVVLWARSTFESDEGTVVVKRGRPLDNWYTGDVHTHAVGDSSLVDNPHCKTDDGRLEPRECASSLVELVLEQAEENALDWFILSEHGPWLGVDGLGDMLDYDAAKGRREWAMVRAAAEERSGASGVRIMMGEEIGSAPPFSNFGHFNAYQIDDYVENDVTKVPDVEYVERLAAAGGWGAINHPDQGGNHWRCWYAVSDPKCEHGIVEYAASRLRDATQPRAFAAIEISNGGAFPPAETLGEWDRMLHQGYMVAAVGGSDAHTLSRGADSWRHAVDGSSSIGKLGVSKTFAYVPEGEYAPPSESYDSTAADDPIRRAILGGRTVASNAGFADVVVGGAQPGGTVPVPTDGAVPLQVLVRWETDFSPGGHAPDSVRIVLGRVATDCGARLCEQVVVVLNPGDAAEQQAADASVGAPPEGYDQILTTVELPAEWDDAYLRVEVTEALPRQAPRFGAFTSPVYVERSDGG